VSVQQCVLINKKQSAVIKFETYILGLLFKFKIKFYILKLFHVSIELKTSHFRTYDLHENFFLPV
jgi:hypothetical protein